MSLLERLTASGPKMYAPAGRQREGWIATLRKGWNPFDTVTPLTLREGQSQSLASKELSSTRK